MNEHDVVRVKETVTVTPRFEDDPIEIQASPLRNDRHRGIMRGIAVFDGDAFRKIEGMVQDDQGLGLACLQMVSNN